MNSLQHCICSEFEETVKYRSGGVTYKVVGKAKYQREIEKPKGRIGSKLHKLKFKIEETW